MKKSKTASKKRPATKKSKPPKSAQSKFADYIKDGVEQVAQKIESIFSSEPKDIVEAIKMDHEDLKGFLGILKDTNQDMTERRRAYKAFSALLKSHSLSEEKAVYVPTMELVGREMHIKVAEGYVEHQVGDDLMAHLDRTKDPLTWSAHANVLSETMEHHLKEEERDLLPLIHKAATPKDNLDMLARFLALRGRSQKRINKKNAGVLKAD